MTSNNFSNIPFKYINVGFPAFGQRVENIYVNNNTTIKTGVSGPLATVFGFFGLNPNASIWNNTPWGSFNMPWMGGCSSFNMGMNMPMMNGMSWLGGFNPLSGLYSYLNSNGIQQSQGTSPEASNERKATELQNMYKGHGLKVTYTNGAFHATDKNTGKPIACADTFEEMEQTLADRYSTDDPEVDKTEKKPATETGGPDPASLKTTTTTTPADPSVSSSQGQYKAESYVKNDEVAKVLKTGAYLTVSDADRPRHDYTRTITEVSIQKAKDADGKATNFPLMFATVAMVFEFDGFSATDGSAIYKSRTGDDPKVVNTYKLKHTARGVGLDQPHGDTDLQGIGKKDVNNPDNPKNKYTRKIS